MLLKLKDLQSSTLRMNKLYSAELSNIQNNENQV